MEDVMGPLLLIPLALAAGAGIVYATDKLDEKNGVKGVDDDESGSIFAAADYGTRQGIRVDSRSGLRIDDADDIDETPAHARRFVKGLAATGGGGAVRGFMAPGKFKRPNARMGGQLPPGFGR